MTSGYPGLRLGRRPPTRAPALALADVLTGQLPPVPAAADYLHPDGWAMLGNDTHGDCVAVTWANVRRLVSRASGAETYPGLDDVIALYRTQNPGFPTDDDGMVIQDALDYLHKQGGPDGVKAVAYAKVDHTDPAQVKAAVAIFGYVWVGVDVQQANMQQFAAGQPWEWVDGSRVVGGHSVVAGGYDSDSLGADELFITWGRETGFTDDYWRRGVEEAWVVVWPEHLGSAAFLEGVDRESLALAYSDLTGRELPLPTVDPPGVDADRALAAAAADWLDNHSHSGEAALVAAALRRWRTARGLG